MGAFRGKRGGNLTQIVPKAGCSIGARINIPLGHAGRLSEDIGTGGVHFAAHGDSNAVHLHGNGANLGRRGVAKDTLYPL